VTLVSPTVYIFALFFLSALFLTPYVLLSVHGRELSDAWAGMKKYSVLIGVGSMGTYLIILFAFQVAKLSYVVAVREFAVVIGAVLGLAVLKERLSASKVLGIALITAGIVLIRIV
jgi:uncharacterized membrane protein